MARNNVGSSTIIVTKHKILEQQNMIHHSRIPNVSMKLLQLFLCQEMMFQRSENNHSLTSYDLNDIENFIVPSPSP